MPPIDSFFKACEKRSHHLLQVIAPYPTMVFITLQNTHGLFLKNNNNNKKSSHAYTTLGCNCSQKQTGVHGKFQVEKGHNCVKKCV